MDKNFNYWQLAPKLDGSEHFNIKMMKFVALLTIIWCEWS